MIIKLIWLDQKKQIQGMVTNIICTVTLVQKRYYGVLITNKKAVIYSAVILNNI